jgi:tyrosinase
MRERKDVYTLPEGDTTLEWYSKAVAEMKTRRADDPTSWWYQAGIHGFDGEDGDSYWAGAMNSLPSLADRAIFWDKCQHQSWYFLSWHRMYLAYFEEIVAQTIVSLGGPADWSLPFWNYSESLQVNPNARIMPEAFVIPNDATNGLWIDGREGGTSLTHPMTFKDVDTTAAMNMLAFTTEGNRTGFGGSAVFNHFGEKQGGLENQPHNAIHNAIGGEAGAMANANAAALDPIFWLHHSDIDRLWQVWLNQGDRQNTNDPTWLGTEFDFHSSSTQAVKIASQDVLNTTTQLGYKYEGVPVNMPMLLEKSLRRNVAHLEVAGATDSSQKIGATKVNIPLSLNPARSKKENFKALNESVSTPKTYTLHLENVKGTGNPPRQDVYLNVSESDGDKESYFAGSVTFFGIEASSSPGEHHSGSGQTAVLDVSELINELRTKSNWKEDQLDVQIEPSRVMGKNSSLTVGRISLYSE